MSAHSEGAAGRKLHLIHQRFQIYKHIVSVNSYCPENTLLSHFAIKENKPLFKKGFKVEKLKGRQSRGSLREKSCRRHFVLPRVKRADGAKPLACDAFKGNIKGHESNKCQRCGTS